MNQSGIDIGDGESKTTYYIVLNGRIVGYCTSDDIDKNWVVDKYIRSESAEIDSNGRKFNDVIEDEWTGSIEGYIEIGPNWDEFRKSLDCVKESKKKAEDYFIDMGRQLIAHAIKDIDFLKRNFKSWDEERIHINPYSKKQKKMIFGGKRQNKGRISAQYFTLRSTRKQNASSKY